jgi:alpha-glucosidase
VRDDLLQTLPFWADRGVDGFRVDVAHLLAKHLVEPLPAVASLASLAHGAHPFEDRDEVHAIYAESHQPRYSVNSG